MVAAMRSRLSKSAPTPTGHGARSAGPSLRRSIGNQATQSYLRQRPAEPPDVVRAIDQALTENQQATPLTQLGLAAAGDQVHLRDDAAADRSARLLGAHAVAVGNQVLFRAGQYAPHTGRGRALIAHEVTHVAHQRRMGRAYPQRSVAGDVLTVQFTQAMAEAMTPGELEQQMQLLRAHLQVEPDAAGATENLAVLEGVAHARAQPAVVPLPLAVRQSDTHQALMGAIMESRWARAAELLNGYNAEGIRAVLATLDPRQIESIHSGAIANGRVGADAQVAKMALVAAPDLPEAEAAVVAGGITMLELTDYARLSHGDFMDKHGVFRFFEVKKRARALPPSVLAHVLPSADTVLYWQASGRVATNADELAHRAAAIRPPSGIGAVAGAASRLFTDDPNIIGAITATGDLLETGLSGVVPRNYYKDVSSQGAGPINQVTLMADRGGAGGGPPIRLLPPGPRPFGLLPPGPQPFGLLPPGPQPAGLLPPGPRPFGLLPPGPQPFGLLPISTTAEFQRVVGPAALAALPVLQTVQPLAPARPGTVIPRTFTLDLVDGERVWVSGAATEHFMEALAGYREYYAGTGRGTASPGAVLRQSHPAPDPLSGVPASLGPREVIDVGGMRGQIRPGADEIARGSTTQTFSSETQLADQYFNRQGPAAATTFASALLLEDFRASVSEAIRTGAPFGQNVVIGNWELMLQPPRGPGQLPQVVHANPRGNLGVAGSRPVPMR